MTTPNNGAFNVSVTLNDLQVMWRTDNSYEFSSQYTPTVSGVSPTTVSASTEMTIVGTGFGSSVAKLNVKVGNQTCQVNSVNDTTIFCDLPGLELGAQSVSVMITGFTFFYFLASLSSFSFHLSLKIFNSHKDLGLASIATGISVTGSASLSGISPSSGSINGGTLISLTGNGFSTLSVVSIDSKPCNVTQASINQLDCITTPDSNGNYSILIR